MTRGDARADETRDGEDENISRDEPARASKRARAETRTSSDASTPPLALYMGRAMLACARDGCVPCRHAVFAAAGNVAAANARPEACPRHGERSERGAKRLGLYARARGRLLTVGDGDFSFSLALARAFGGETIVATSHETRESLVSIYGSSCEETLDELAELGVAVAHGVDAGDLEATLPARCRKGPFDCVIWNFPCVARAADGTAQEAALNGVDARSAEELEANRALVERFVAGAAAFIAEDGGEIHVTHKVGMQCDWSIDKAASSSGDSGLVCAGAVVFDRMAYPSYRPRKALVAKSFPVTDARTFIFTNSKSGESVTLSDKSKLVSRVVESTK